MGEVERFADWLEEQPDVSVVGSYVGMLKSLNKAENGNDEAWHKLPEDNLQVIDYLVSYQLVQEIEPHLSPIFDPEYTTVRSLRARPIFPMCNCSISTAELRPGTKRTSIPSTVFCTVTIQFCMRA